MVFALALFLIFLTILIHEVGHAIAMNKTGVGVAELGIGIGKPNWPRISHTFVSKKNPSETFTLSLYPFLIGAFVRPRHEERISKLCYKDRAFIYGAGILANLFFILLALVILAVFFPEVHLRMIPPWATPLVLITAMIPLFWYARAITAYIFPPVSIAVMYWFINILLHLSGTALVENAGGIVFAGQLAKSFSKEIWQAIYFGGFISFALAATNILPIYPLDGGQTMSAIIHRISTPIGGYFDRLGFLFFLILIIYSVGGDIRRIVLMFQ